MKKQILYGMLGFLSLLGFAGVFTEARGFLGFFAFAVDFQYFFLKSDEMLEAQLARSASRAFVVGMLMMAAAVLGTLTLGGFTPQRALLTGCTVGWAASVVVYALQFAMPSELHALPGARELAPLETVSGVPIFEIAPDILACAGGVSKVNAAMAAELLPLCLFSSPVRGKRIFI